eukprot:Nitzschia sp. Nitz4//scaffold79_size90958//36858//38351//NITZ4_005021-RA/size90958-augustus-gene-0.176-mRNA-1//-1//CDS//3329558237//1387//frame0
MKFSVAAALVATLAPAASQEVIGLHGSGTTNPSKCFWHIMDLFHARTKLPTKMTYRAVGSTTGQEEFTGDITTPDNDFGSGDIPFSAEAYAAFPDESILHLPIALGAINFFHSVPTGDSELSLTPCVLAKIFSRQITTWTDSEIMDLNPNLSLEDGYPIKVAHRVKGSSSTASITAYLHAACEAEWPESMVGSTITWDDDTMGCEGSGGMTSCIVDNEGTIGYIDSGHGLAEGVAEIKIRNADGVYINSQEAAARGGILAATENAGFPDTLDASFADVDLLNQPGASTWPIVAMTYVYVRKDLTFMSNPASQTLLKAFLEALYHEDYMPVCEEEFGFVRVTGTLQEKALAAIADLNVTAGAPDWTFEQSTSSRVGQGDYVISVKRGSYSEIEQDAAVDSITTLTEELEALKASYAALLSSVDSLVETVDSAQYAVDDDDDDDDKKLKTALALGSVSFSLWILAIIGGLVAFVSK